MRIAVMGAGALGAYFGGRLAEAGDEVAFFARGPHLNAIRARGLKVVSALGDIHLKDCLATNDPADIGPVDIVLFTVKLGDMESAAAACRPLIGDDTGVVEHIGDFARLQFGSTDETAQARLGAFLERCQAAGIEAALVDDIQKTLWEKFTVLLALSTLTTAARTPVGPIRAEDNGRATLIAVIEETAAVGLKAVKPLETPWLSGSLVRMGRDAGVPTPVNTALYAVILPHVGGGRGDR